MGALVACYAARAHQDWFNGLIITSPAMDVDKNLTLKIQSLFGAPLEALAPWARLVPAVVVDDLSESEEVRPFSFFFSFLLQQAPVGQRIHSSPWHTTVTELLRSFFAVFSRYMSGVNGTVCDSAHGCAGTPSLHI